MCRLYSLKFIKYSRYTHALIYTHIYLDTRLNYLEMKLFVSPTYLFDLLKKDELLPAGSAVYQ